MNNWASGWRKLIEWDEDIKMNTIGMKLNALTGLLSWKVKMSKIKKNLILMQFGIC